MIRERAPRALVINTGNANAGTGEDGLPVARQTAMCGLRKGARLHGEQVLPFSTGVIMEPLPVDRIEAGLPHVHCRPLRRTTGPTRHRRS